MAEGVLELCKIEFGRETEVLKKLCERLNEEDTIHVPYGLKDSKRRDHESFVLGGSTPRESNQIDSLKSGKAPGEDEVYLEAV